MTANADLLSDALVAALTAAAPAGCLVKDHQVLPLDPAQIPDAGYICVFMAEDQPKEDGYSDSLAEHERMSTFKVAIRTKGDPTAGFHILHGTRALRQIVAQAVRDAEASWLSSGLAHAARMMAWRPQVVETTLSIGCAEMDVLIDYRFSPEVA